MFSRSWGASSLTDFVLRFIGVEIHRSARRHGLAEGDIVHAVEHALATFEVDEDPTKDLVIGPDRAANLLEVVVLVLDGDRLIVIHAMPLRDRYHYLLPKGDPGA
jgi:hypothetical protein